MNAATGRWTPELAVDLRVPTEPRIAPDGRWVAFSVNPIGHRERDATSAIFVVPSDGSAAPRALTGSEHNNVQPRWSPDGSRIAFLSDRPERGKSQLHVVPVAGGEPLRLTTLVASAGNARWLPDGSGLAFTAPRRALAGEPESKPDIKVASERWKPHGIALVPVTGGALRRVGPQAGHVWTFALAPDGTRIAALVSATESLAGTWDSVRLIVCALDGSDERELLRLTGFPSAVSWSPDGSTLALLGSQLPDIDPTNVYLVDVASGALTVLDDRGMSPGWVGFDDDGVLVHSVRTQWTQLERTDARGSEWDALDLGPQVADHWIESGVNIDARDGALAFTAARSDRPPDVFFVPARGAALRLTDLNPQLAGIAFSAMQHLEWQASDGTTVHGWLILPPGADETQRLPLVAAIHGGPSWQWGGWFHGTWHDWGQLLAGAGYAVFMPNFRGSTGRGGAYTGSNRFDFGGGDFDDIMTGIDMLVERGVADTERLGICGWSYGGFMTAWAVTHTDRFKAAVAGAAPTNWVSKIGTTDIRPYNEWNLGEVNVDPDKVWERSPIRYVRDVTTPTLLVHGEADVRVPIGQAWEFHDALLALGVPTDLVAYPRQGHAFSERAHQLDLLQRLLGWFERYL